MDFFDTTDLSDDKYHSFLLSVLPFLNSNTIIDYILR